MPFLDEDGVTRLTEDYLDIFAPKEELGEGDGTNAGPIYELSAKGHAEQFSTTGKNLWSLGDQTFTRYRVLTLDSPLSEGTYTMSAVVTSSDTDASICTILVYLNDDSTILLTFTRDQRASAQIVASKPIVKMNLYASDTNVHGEGDTATFLNIQLELGSEATEYEPYTGGAPSPSPDYPQEIQVVRGRNLVDESAPAQTGVYLNREGYANTSAVWSISDYIEVEEGKTYTISMSQSGSNPSYCLYSSTKAYVSGEKYSSNMSKTFTVPSGVKYVMLSIPNNGAIQLTLGSTSQPYVPYGHVGMEVLDPDTDELISCTPIPLPQRGWVGGLPDGTSDILTLDGAGKCEWELADAETTTAATDGITGTVGTDLLSTTGQIADGATVLYKLATPITEDMGYIEDWPTDIPEGAIITIPELDALNVKYFVANDSISKYANQWYERTKAVDIAEVEDAVAELTTEVAIQKTYDQFYIAYHLDGQTLYPSIFRRSDA